MSFGVVLMALVMVGIFAAIITIALKAENKKTAETVSQLSPDQKNRLMNAEIWPVSGQPNCWIQEMLIISMKDKGKKMGVHAIYYNLTIKNNTYKTFCPADFSVSKEEVTATGLSVGSFAKVYVNPEKGAKLA